MPLPIVIFAQIPPPEHGQSRMVMLALEAFQSKPEEFDVHHVNARFSTTLEQIGEGSIGKLVLTIKYLVQAVWLRAKLNDPLLYYVPGPVKWSAVFRDWVLLFVLRMFYRRVVFHWHAIGQGEWAHGSDRKRLCGPAWLDRVARRISAGILEQPFASIAVCDTSCKDARAVGSGAVEVILNGINDPCPDFDRVLAPQRAARQRELSVVEKPCFKVLFLSYGTEEKGLMDAVDCLDVAMSRCDPDWHICATFVGGVTESLRARFEKSTQALRLKWQGRLKIHIEGYLTGNEKQQHYEKNDVFLCTSRWESFGLTVVEAMAHGMQIVASASDGVQGILPCGYPYLAPVADTSALGDRLIACCQNLRKNPAIDGNHATLRQRFLDHFQLKDFTSNLIATFLNLRSISCSGGVSPSLITHAPEKPATVIDRRYSTGFSSSSKIPITVYLADQNPKLGRSLGISRMTEVLLQELAARDDVDLSVVTSRSSLGTALPGVKETRLPWSTRSHFKRLMTDHLHALGNSQNEYGRIFYYPKGFLPFTSNWCRPSVVTIHDTIIQYYSDHYPKWRKRLEYGYWASVLRHTLREANAILTVSHSSKRQIEAFMARHGIAPREIHVTYEACIYESTPQPVNPDKCDYVIHLASREPHKRTAQLIRWWAGNASHTNGLLLHLVGSIPEEVAELARNCPKILVRPFLEEPELQLAITGARALVFPSEVEGFGLPALEAYYLGTPVCFTRGTSVEEVLSVGTNRGSFELDDMGSMFAALSDVMAMTHTEIHQCGLALREAYAAKKVVGKMMEVFSLVAERHPFSESLT